MAVALSASMTKPSSISLMTLALFVTACATDLDDDEDPNPEVDDGELIDEPGQASIGPEVPETISACAVTVSKPAELMIKDLAVVEETLMKIRPYVRYFHSSSYINDLAAGEICLALGWSGDVLQARDRGAAAAKPVKVAYTIPREGALNYFDMLAIPADAPHPANAHAFLNHLMEPEVIAKVTNKVRFANGNAASLPFVDESIRNDPSIYPSAEVRVRLHPDLAETQAFSRDLNRSWTRIRTGQ